MKRRRVVAALVVGVASFAVSKLLRRRAAQRRDRVDLYFEDGSMVSFAEGSDEGDRLLPVAADLLAGLLG